MNNEHITKFVLDLRGLTTSEKAVALSIAFHADADGANSDPSMSTIATESGYKNRQNARRVVRRLEAKGVIVAECRDQITMYRFNMGREQ